MMKNSRMTGLAKRVALGLLPAMLALAIPGIGLADPVPSSNIPVFCFRITDIERVVGDPGDDRFRFEFEVLNWTHAEAFGVYIALNEGTGVGGVSGSAPFFAGAAIDSDGRPLVLKDVNGDGAINATDLEDANGNGVLDPGEDQNANSRLDNDPMPGNLNPPNDWTVPLATTTAITWTAGTPVSGIDLIGFLSGTPLQPGDPEIAFMQFTNPADPTTLIAETIDDGPNVLDGYVFAVDDLDPGEIISFNWFLTDVTGQVISDVEIGVSPYGFGVVNITSVVGDVLPGPVFVGNTSFSQSSVMFFDGVFNVPNPAEFAAEFGAAITAAFLNPADNIFNMPVTTQLLPRALDVAIDVKPRRSANVIELDDDECDDDDDDDDRLLVAILTTPDFDALTVDVATLKLGDPALGGTAPPIRLRARDVDRDGDKDLLLVFSLCDLLASGALDANSTELVLSGQTSGGLSITGQDSVQVVSEDEDD